MPILRLLDGSLIYEKDILPRLVESGRLVRYILQELIKNAVEGNTTLELNKLAEDLILKNKAESLFKGFENYPYTTCISVNEHIVHGFPSEYKLKNGDVVSLDLGLKLNGICGDNARTIIIGNIESEHTRLVQIAKEAFYEGFKHAFPGKCIGDIGFAISKKVLSELKDNTNRKSGSKFKIFFKFQGHGIGLSLHELPNIPNLGYPGKGYRLKEGNSICIEPVVLYSSSEPVIEEYSTHKGVLKFTTNNLLPSSHYENQIYIAKDGPIILTSLI
jgi:methionyl aminopeptidase